MSKKDSSGQLLIWETGESKRKCARCKKVKSFSQFPLVKSGSGREARRTSYCNQCRKIKSRRNHRLKYKKNSEYMAKMKARAIEARWRKVIREFGVDERKYNEMEAAQNGLCAICGCPETARFKGTLRRLCIDHDHETGVVRKLLCLDCNAGIGRFKERPDLLRNAIAYLALYGKG